MSSKMADVMSSIDNHRTWVLKRLILQKIIDESKKLKMDSSNSLEDAVVYIMLTIVTSPACVLRVQ